jgi:hypothetical protein
MSVFSSRSDSGALIVDTSCLKRLAYDDVRARFVQQLRLIDFAPWPSAVNAIEVAALSDSRYRTRYQEVLRFLADGRALLPWPHDVLKDIGLALSQKHRRVRLRTSGFEFLIREPVGQEHVALAQRVTADSRQSWQNIYSHIRSDLQRFIRARLTAPPWSDAHAFLDEVVLEPAFLRTFVSSLWAAFDLPGKAPVQALLASGPWRAFIEAYGILAYERGIITSAEPKQAHVWDLLQLVYIAGPSRKILVSEDRAFLRAAKLVIEGRYPNASVLHWDSFLE